MVLLVSQESSAKKLAGRVGCFWERGFVGSGWW